MITIIRKFNEMVAELETRERLARKRLQKLRYSIEWYILASAPIILFGIGMTIIVREAVKHVF